jgi:hypothetical protein
MFDFLIEEIRLCAEGADPDTQSSDKTTRKKARLKVWARAKGIRHPKSLRTGQKKAKDSLGVRKKESDKDKWGHPSRFPVSDFEASVEEIRYCIEGGGSRRSKDKRQMAYVQQMRRRAGGGKALGGRLGDDGEEPKTAMDRGIMKSLYRGRTIDQPFGTGRGKLPKDPK